MPEREQTRRSVRLSREIILAHDVRALCHRLGLLVEGLELGTAQTTDAIEVLEASVAELDRVVGELGRRGAADAEPLDLNALVREALAGTARGEEILLVERYAPVPPVLGDAAMIRGAFARAAENAVEALAAAGAVTARSYVEPWASGGALPTALAVVIEIADDGAGMSRRFVEERLFRLGDAGSPRSGETRGAGAWAYREVAERHGGDVQVRSAEGRGTCVRFRFPAVARNAAQGQAAGAEPISASRSPTCPGPNDS